MVNFIVCEDNNIVLQKNIDIINETMFENNMDYRIYPFSEYSDLFKETIKADIENKIYILDIELDDISGIDIASDIRNIDLDSLIIISTTHTEYLPYTLKSKLMLFDYVSKFEDYEQNLSKTIEKALDAYSLNRYITFRSNKKDRKLLLKDVMYIRYDINKRCTIIKSRNGYYETYKSFKSLVRHLDDRFEMKNINFYNNTHILPRNKHNFSHRNRKGRSVKR